MKYFEKILLYTARGALFASIFTPLVFTASMIFPYIQPRTLYLEMLSTVGAITTALLLFFFKEYRKPLLRSRTLQIVLLFLVSNLVLSLASVDTTKSFFGSIERASGFVQLAYIGALTFIACSVLTTKRLWNIVFGLTAAVGVAACAHYIFAVIGDGGSIYQKTITGNKTFLAGLGILSAASALHLSRELKHKALQWLLYGAALFLAIVTIATAIRAGFVGIVIGVIVIVAHSITKSSGQTKKWIIGCAALFVLLYGSIFLARDTESIRRIDILNRITHFNTETTKSRFVLWKMAWDGFKANPILGWGRENFSLVYNVHFDKRFDSTGVTEVWDDSPHNVFLNELINGGIIGFTTYSLLFVVLGMIFWSTSSFLFAGIIGYMVSNFFGIETINTLVTLFLLLGYAAFIELEKQGHSVSSGMWKEICIVIIFIASASSVGIVRSYQADTQYFSAIRWLMLGHGASLDAEYARAESKMKNAPYQKSEVALILGVQAGGLPETSKNLKLHALEMAVARLKDEYNRNPIDLRIGFNLSKFQSYIGYHKKDVAMMKEAELILNTMIRTVADRAAFRNLLEGIQEQRKKIEPAPEQTGPVLMQRPLGS